MRTRYHAPLRILLLLLLAALPAGSAYAVVDGAAVNRIVWNGFSSEYGEAVLDLTLSGSVEYVNVLADLDGSGSFVDYPSGPETQTEWVGRNVPVPAASGEMLRLSLPFPLVDPSVSVGGSVVVGVTVTSTPIPRPSVGSATFFGVIGTGARHDPGAGKEASIAGLFPDPAGGAGGFNAEFLATGAPVALTDLPYNFGVPDNAQPDGVTCGPTSAANSLRWLARKHGFNNKLPAADADLINDLKGAGYMMTSAPGGTTDPKYVTGKQTYINDKKLPITQKFKDGNTTIGGQAQEKPTLDFLLGELKKGEDVEIGFTYTGAGGGGHWVTLVGLARWSDGAAYAYVNDPADKLNGAQRYQLKSRADGYLELSGYGAGHFIDIVVSESFDPALPAVKSTWGRVKAIYR